MNNHVFSEARFAAEVGGTSESADAEGPVDHGAVLWALVDEERFPAVRRVLEAGVFEPSEVDRDAEFTFGLERILDGIERLVDERQGKTS